MGEPLRSGFCPTKIRPGGVCQAPSRRLQALVHADVHQPRNSPRWQSHFASLRVLPYEDMPCGCLSGPKQAPTGAGARGRTPATERDVHQPRNGLAADEDICRAQYRLDLRESGIGGRLCVSGIMEMGAIGKPTASGGRPGSDKICKRRRLRR